MLFALPCLSLPLVQPTEVAPKGDSVRYPQWMTMNDQLFLFWEAPYNYEHLRLSYLLYADKGVEAPRQEVAPQKVEIEVEPFGRYPYYRIAGSATESNIIYSWVSHTVSRVGISSGIDWAPLTAVNRTTIAVDHFKHGSFPPDGSTYELSYYYPIYLPYHKQHVLLWDIEQWGENYIKYGKEKDRWGIWLAKTPDGGHHWSHPVRLTPKGSLPDATVAGDRLLVVAINRKPPVLEEGCTDYRHHLDGWPDEVFDNDPNIDRSGATPIQGKLQFWSLRESLKPISAPKTIVAAADVTAAALASDGRGTINVVYTRGGGNIRSYYVVQSTPESQTFRVDLSPLYGHLWLITSTDNGRTWGKPVQLTNEKSVDRDPCIAFYHNTFWIACSRTENPNIDSPSAIEIISRPLAGRVGRK